jgi:hypothetical protein
MFLNTLKAKFRAGELEFIIFLLQKRDYYSAGYMYLKVDAASKKLDNVGISSKC